MMELPLVAAFLVGFMGSSHCLGMCGGISALVVSDQSGKPALSRLLLYNAGRLLTYTLIGVGLGMLGQQLVEWQQSLLAYLRLLAAFMLIALGLYITQLWQGLRQLEKLGALLWRRVQPLSRYLLPARRAHQVLALGLLWGLLPCGLVYSTAVWALSLADGVQAGWLMLMFGLGTLPAMLASGMAGQWLWQLRQRPQIRLFAGSLLIVMGLVALWFPLMHSKDNGAETPHDHHRHHTVLVTPGVDTPMRG